MFDLNVCKISRRGKGAKGTVEVKTLGIPVLDDDGIAKDWDYSKFLGMDSIELMVALQQFCNINLAMVEGVDKILKSESMKAQNEAVVLAAKILEMNLEANQDDADNRAKVILQTVKNMRAAGIDEEHDNMELLTVDYWLEKHARNVAKKRKADAMLPKLVK